MSLLNSIDNILNNIKNLKTSKIVILSLILYPLFFIWLFRNNIVITVDNIINKKEILVEVQNLNNAIKRMGKILNDYESTAVMLYIYQPVGHDKRYKERIYCASDIYIPEYYTEKILIIDDTKVISDFLEHKYSKATHNTTHALSIELAGHNLNCAYYIPIYYDNELIGELVLIYENDKKLNIEIIYNVAQLFMYDIMSPPLSSRSVEE